MIHKLEIREIIPPHLEAENLGQIIYCYRASRGGGPHMCIERKNEKIIAHNYGHTSSGWSVGPGSAQYITNILTSKIKEWGLDKGMSIAVIGAGALGLYTAYTLQKNGYRSLSIIAENFNNLPSHYAGGLFSPPSALSKQEKTNGIARYSYSFYRAIAHKTHPDFEEGALMMPAYFKNIMTNYQPLINERIMVPPQYVMLDFGNGIIREAVAYDESIFIDVATMMANLHAFLRKSKHITFKQKKISSFNDIDEKIICNCTGLGAMELNQDHAMVSSQGHLILLSKQIPENLNYLISFSMGSGKTFSGESVQYSCGFYPKYFKDHDTHHIGAIGSTLIRDTTASTPNHEQIPIIWRNAKKFFYGCY